MSYIFPLGVSYLNVVDGHEIGVVFHVLLEISVEELEDECKALVCMDDIV